MKKISVIIPCLNSGKIINETFAALRNLKQAIHQKGLAIEFVFVNDGSIDNTLDLLQAFKAEMGEDVCIVDLTGNFGSYNALLAGCHYATGDCNVQLHDDLQDPPEYIPDMLEHWLRGYKLVIGQRVERDEPPIHQFFAKTYHWLMKEMALPHIPAGGYDLVLFDRVIREHIVSMNESNTNLIYLISWLQYPYVSIPIKRHAIKTPSRWSFLKRTKLAIDSFVSFSYSPIRLVTVMALISIIIFLLMSAFVIITEGYGIYWFISLFGMFVMVSLSITVEYLYRTLHAARQRPPFIVKQVY